VKILIVRFSSIGDIVLTTPVVRCLKAQTGATIDFLTKINFKSVVETNPNINRVITIEKKYTEVIKDLQSQQYDFVIDLQNNLHSWQLKRSLSVKSYSFPKLNVEKWILVNTKINILPSVHIVDRYLSTCAALGVKNDGRGLDYFIPTAQQVRPQDSFSQLEGTKYIAFVIGAAHATKRLPEAKIIAICQKINHPIVLLGGKEEAGIGARIVALAGGQVINACGKFSLHQSASWVAQAQLVITHDTGLMHIAAAYAKNIISIWGNTTPDFGMFPYYPKDVNNNISIEVKTLNCRPCSKIGHSACPKGHFNCMNQIDEAAILTAVEKFWS
jgi:ADP-heptose:LPS heptosyltransferase